VNPAGEGPVRALIQVEFRSSLNIGLFVRLPVDEPLLKVGFNNFPVYCNIRFLVNISTDSSDLSIHRTSGFQVSITTVQGDFPIHRPINREIAADNAHGNG